MQPFLTITRHLKTGDRTTIFSVVDVKKFARLIWGIPLVAIGCTGLQAYGEHMHMEQLRPQMIALADAGGQEAGVWLVKNFWETESRRLPALVEAGVPGALYLSGLKTIHDGDSARGNALIAQAAATGYLPAMQRVERH